MYRAILPEGEIQCERYEQTEYGLKVYTADDEFLAFLPYANLVALINDEVETTDDRTIW